MVKAWQAYGLYEWTENYDKENEKKRRMILKKIQRFFSSNLTTISKQLTMMHHRCMTLCRIIFATVFTISLLSMIS